MLIGGGEVLPMNWVSCLSPKTLAIILDSIIHLLLLCSLHKNR